MEASASLRRTHIPTGVVRLFLIAVVAAFLLGGAGGYLMRGSSVPASTTSGTKTNTQSFGVEQIPFISPVPSPASQPTLDPTGRVIPI